MRGVLTRRRGEDREKERASCALLTCPHCGLQLESLAFRCPRCLHDIPLGCSGNCHA